MKSVVDSLLCAFMLFSPIPVTRSAWNKGGIRYALCFKPLVGVLKTVLLLLWYELCVILGLNSVLFAAVAAMLPVVMSRGLHLSGFVSVTDAALSRAPLQKRLLMLANTESGAGAHGVVSVCAYMLLQLGLFSQIFDAGGSAVVLPAAGYVASAALSAVSTVIIPPAKPSGLGFTLYNGSHRNSVLVCGAASYLIAILFCINISFVWGLSVAGLCVAFFFLHRNFCVKTFGGNSGALAGTLMLGVEMLFSAAAIIASI